MPEILLVGVAESERPRLQSLSEHREALSHDACAELAATPARVALLGGDDAATVLRSMQRLHGIAPELRIAVLADGLVLDRLRGLMRTAPDVPVDVDLWRQPVEDLPERMATLCRQARQESALQSSLSAVRAPGAGSRVVGATLDAVLEHAPVGVVITDRQRRILAWNPAAADLLGLQGRDLGAPVGDQFLTGEHVHQLVERAAAGELADPAGAVETVAGRDGAFLDVRAASTHLADGREAVLVLVQDSTARHRAEEARDRLSAQVRMIGGISEALLGAVDEGEVLTRVMRQVVPTLADWVELQVYDDRLNTRKVSAYHRDGGLAELTRRVEECHAARHVRGQPESSDRPGERADPDVDGHRRDAGPFHPGRVAAPAPPGPRCQQRDRGAALGAREPVGLDGPRLAGRLPSLRRERAGARGGDRASGGHRLGDVATPTTPACPGRGAPAQHADRAAPTAWSPDRGALPSGRRRGTGRRRLVRLLRAARRHRGPDRGRRGRPRLPCGGGDGAAAWAAAWHRVRQRQPARRGAHRPRRGGRRPSRRDDGLGDRRGGAAGGRARHGPPARLVQRRPSAAAAAAGRGRGRDPR